MCGELIHLIYGSDDNYIFPTMVSAASAAKCLGVERSLVVHLFDAGVSDAHWGDFARTVSAINENVKCVRHIINKSMFKGFGDWKGSVVTYSRMFMADILPDIDWAIYIDGDTLWVGDIGKLWDLRDESKMILASIDPPPPCGVPGNLESDWYREHGIDFDAKDYLCMGLMLANLKLQRECGIPRKCRQFMQENPLPRVVDQTVLNYVCRGYISPLPPEWGVFSAWHGTVDLTKGGVIHYVSDVPWKRDKVNRLLSDVVMIWYDFCKQVLKRDELLTRVGWFSRAWRRVLFVFFKHNQWLLGIHPFIKSRFRNTHGFNAKELVTIRGRLLYQNTKKD